MEFIAESTSPRLVLGVASIPCVHCDSLPGIEFEGGDAAQIIVEAAMSTKAETSVMGAGGRSQGT